MTKAQQFIFPLKRFKRGAALLAFALPLSLAGSALANDSDAYIVIVPYFTAKCALFDAPCPVRLHILTPLFDVQDLGRGTHDVAWGAGLRLDVKVFSNAIRQERADQSGFDIVDGIEGSVAFTTDPKGIFLDAGYDVLFGYRPAYGYKPGGRSPGEPPAGTPRFTTGFWLGARARVIDMGLREGMFHTITTPVLFRYELRKTNQQWSVMTTLSASPVRRDVGAEMAFCMSVDPAMREHFCPLVVRVERIEGHFEEDGSEGPGRFYVFQSSMVLGRL